MLNLRVEFCGLHNIIIKVYLLDKIRFLFSKEAPNLYVVQHVNLADAARMFN